ncbi:MAG: NUDIX domain-containing protein [Patescibacteria group bacterium]
MTNKIENVEPQKQKYSVLVNAIVVRDGKILLCQRSMEEEHVPGKWCPPGGKLEETTRVVGALQKTAQREVFEETNVEVEDEMRLLINNTFRHDEDDLLVLAVVFMCRYKSGEAKPMEDTIDVKWITEDEIESVQFTHPSVKDYIVKAFEAVRAGLF